MTGDTDGQDMGLRLVQMRTEQGHRRLAAAQAGDRARLIDGVETTYDLARLALARQVSLATIIRQCCSATAADLAAAERDGRLLAPIDHPDPAHCFLTGTGLTHLGSAASRDRMHRDAAAGQATDSMRMFERGLESGKPADGEVGAEPEWFYKGNGSSIVATGETLWSPSFAQDGSEEPELAGIYVVDADGKPWRVGFCLANEFSDHVTERGNYLSLAHSKLRPASLGPELLLELPADVRGTSRILRDGAVAWEKPFLTGEANMSHSIRNLEYHHFKYPLFRSPGDVHVHFFGTATLSFADGFKTRAGDVFEIEAEPFALALRNPLGSANPADPGVKVL
jgi:hypothetical protein